ARSLPEEQGPSTRPPEVGFLRRALAFQKKSGWLRSLSQAGVRGASETCAVRINSIAIREARSPCRSRTATFSPDADGGSVLPGASFLHTHRIRHHLML